MAVTPPKLDRKQQLENNDAGEISQASKRAKLSAHATPIGVLSKKDHNRGSNLKRNLVCRARVEHHLPFDAVSSNNVGSTRKYAHDEEVLMTDLIKRTR